MPELPETETIARDLDAALRGAYIRDVEVIRSDVLRGEGLTSAEARAVLCAAIRTVSRRAKSIVIDLASDHRVVVTPRFTGALLISDEEAQLPPPPYSCLRFLLRPPLSLGPRLLAPRSLLYQDVRRLGTVELMSPQRFTEWSTSLGPEPLDPTLTAERFSGILRGSNRAVKSVLMDQKRLAGVGNIYANEALWRAGIGPTRRASAVTRAEAARLLDGLQQILKASIALRGTTFRDFQDAYGGRGGYAKELQVYGRGGEPCPRCGGTLQETHKLEGRSTVWCRTCQR